jgi:chemotaxis protein CheC
MSNSLEKIGKQASLNASGALSKMINMPVQIELAKMGIKGVNDLDPIIGLKEMIVGIFQPVTGDIKGATLLIISQESAVALCDLLLRRKAKAARKLTEIDKSALKEVGNIITCNYLAVLSNELRVKIIEHVPRFSFDTFGAILGRIIPEFAEDAEKALVIEIEFDFEPAMFKAYFLLLLSLDGFMTIFGERAIVGGVHE